MLVQQPDFCAIYLYQAIILTGHHKQTAYSLCLRVGMTQSGAESTDRQTQASRTLSAGRFPYLLHPESHSHTCSVNLGTGQISKVTNYKTVALLPFQVTYPQTASIHILPLTPANNYNAEIIVLGGSSKDGADATTPATPYTYRLNLADTTATLQWTRESMSCPRIMPDGVLLPDGTLAIFNGGEIGVAGANNPGSGES